MSDQALTTELIRFAQAPEGGDLATALVNVQNLGARGWLAMAAIIGAHQERAPRGSGILDKTADTFGLHRSRAALLGRIYREIIKPRLDRDGHRAEWPLRETQWYETAIKLASGLGKEPLEILEDAERSREREPKLTVRKWRTSMGVAAGKPIRLLEEATRAIELGATAKRALKLVAHLTPEGQFLFADDEFAALLGRTSEELLTRTAGDVAWDQGQYVHALRAIIESRRDEDVALDWESRFVHASGNEVKVRLIIVLEYSPRSMRLQHVRWYLVNAEAAYSGKRGRRVLVADQNGVVQHVSPEMAQLYGALPAEIEGKHLEELTHTPTRAQRLLETLRSGGSVGPEESKRHNLRRLDGKMVPARLDVTVLTNSRGEFVGIAMGDADEDPQVPNVPNVAHVPTTRLPAGSTWILDPEGYTLSISAALAERLGRAASSIVGHHWADFVADSELVVTGVEPFRAPGRIQIDMLRIDGGIVRLFLTYSPRYNESGEFLGVVAIAALDADDPSLSAFDGEH